MKIFILLKPFQNCLADYSLVASFPLKNGNQRKINIFSKLNILSSFFKVLIYLFLSFPFIAFGEESSSITNHKTLNIINKTNQELETKTLEHYLTHSMLFQRIEAGSFTMGSPKKEAGRDNDENQVQVIISKAFEIMKTEVTQSEWFRVMGNNPSYFKEELDCDEYDYENKMCPNNPVENVSYYDVEEFIKKLNDSLGLTSCSGGGIGRAGGASGVDSSRGCYRLPTEAEWEYVARAGTNKAYSFGDEPSNLSDYAWYKDNAKSKTHRVGMKKPNLWGLYDVHGNVWELVKDKYVKDLPGGKDPISYFDLSSFDLSSFDFISHVKEHHFVLQNFDLNLRSNYLLLSALQSTKPVQLSGLKGESKIERRESLNINLFSVIRGGSLNTSARGCRSAYRGTIYPNLKFSDIGFRLVRTL